MKGKIIRLTLLVGVFLSVLDHFRSFYKVTWADALVRGPAPWPGSVARDSRPARRDRGSRAGQGTRPTLR
jgi:hypothetical protein